MTEYNRHVIRFVCVQFSSLELCEIHTEAVINNFTVTLQGGPKKVSHYQMINKSYEIVLKPVNEILFLRQIEV